MAFTSDRGERERPRGFGSTAMNPASLLDTAHELVEGFTLHRNSSRTRRDSARVWAADKSPCSFFWYRNSM
jgi:hypothetical protein